MATLFQTTHAWGAGPMVHAMALLGGMMMMKQHMHCYTRRVRQTESFVASQ
jgi:hypothetical protein